MTAKTYRLAITGGHPYLRGGVQLELRVPFEDAGRRLHGVRGSEWTITLGEKVTVEDAVVQATLEGLTDDDGAPLFDVVTGSGRDLESEVFARFRGPRGARAQARNMLAPAGAEEKRR